MLFKKKSLKYRETPMAGIGHHASPDVGCLTETWVLCLAGQYSMNQSEKARQIDRLRGTVGMQPKSGRR